jgi:hypothetical protein
MIYPSRRPQQKIVPLLKPSYRLIKHFFNLSLSRRAVGRDAWDSSYAPAAGEETYEWTVDLVLVGESFWGKFAVEISEHNDRVDERRMIGEKDDSGFAFGGYFVEADKPDSVTQRKKQFRNCPDDKIKHHPIP